MSESRRFSVAVVGATGAVGEALLTVLAEREFPVDKLFALGSGKAEDETVLFAERPVHVLALAEFDFSRCQLAFFCAPAAVAKKYVPKAIAAGCRVIDVSSQFRLQASVSLVVPEVNGVTLALDEAGVVASPSAAAAQLASVLNPLQRAVGLRRVDVTTLLPVSTLGKPGVDELAGQTARLLNAQAVKQHTFPTQIAFNLIPAFDAISESGYTLDELNVAAEVKKLLAAEGLVVSATQVFAPVFYGVSQVVRVETIEPLTAAKARQLLSQTVGIKLSDAAKSVVSPVDGHGGDDVIKVGRIRQVPDDRHSLTLWTVADNIRKGAAVNSVQIAETLLKPHL